MQNVSVRFAVAILTASASFSSLAAGNLTSSITGSESALTMAQSLSSDPKIGAALPPVAIPAAAPVISPKIVDPAPTALELNYDDRGKAFDLSVNQSLNIDLRYNPNSGNHWVITAHDDSVLKFVNEDRQPQAPPQSGGPSWHPGLPGLETFHFQAVAAGQTTLSLAYQGPSAPQGHEFQITVTIH